jgi:hypothetical protein
MSARFLPMRSSKHDLQSPQEHVADSAVGGGGHELIGAQERSYMPRVRHLSRFRWAFIALILAGLASVGAAVALSASGGRTTATAAGPSWSAWSPPDAGLAGAQEIADYVAPYYRATPAYQLAVVTAVNLNNPASPLEVVVPSNTSGSLLPLPAGSTVVYNLCGEGSSNCSIGVGQPSVARLLLLRREALELALYTFRYISGTQYVVAMLPPGYTTQSCTGICAKSHQKPVTKPLDLALAFERPELAPWLGRPLKTTLPEALPPTVSQMANAPEAELVSVITAHGLFSEKTAQAQDGSTVITLSPLQPQ